MWNNCGVQPFLLVPAVLYLRLLFRKLFMVGPYLLSLLDAGIALQGLITQVCKKPFSASTVWGIRGTPAHKKASLNWESHRWTGGGGPEAVRSKPGARRLTAAEVSLQPEPIALRTHLRGSKKQKRGRARGAVPT